VGFVIRVLITAAGLWVASAIVPGIVIEKGTDMVLAAVVLGVVNAVVRPIAVVLTFPITLLTLGLFLWVINAAMLALTAALLDSFHIAGFGSALVGSLVVGLTGWVGNSFVGPRGRYEVLVVRGQS